MGTLNFVFTVPYTSSLVDCDCVCILGEKFVAVGLEIFGHWKC